MTTTQKEEVSTLILQGFILLFMGIAGFIGLVAGGFDTDFVINTYTIYGVYFLVGFLSMHTAIQINKFIKTKDNKYGDSISFNSLGKAPALSFFKKFNWLQIYMICLILFSVIGLLGQTFTGQSFTKYLGAETPFVKQQFTETGSILFSTFIVATAENMAIAGFFALAMSITLMLLTRRFNWAKDNYFTLYWLIGLSFFPILWVGLHLLTYGGQESALYSVFLFGFTGAFLTLLTGSFMPWFALHQVNNLFLDLRRYFGSNEVLFTVAIFIILALGGIYFFLNNYFWKKRRIV